MFRSLYKVFIVNMIEGNGSLVFVVYGYLTLQSMFGLASSIVELFVYREFHFSFFFSLIYTVFNCCLLSLSYYYYVDVYRKQKE